MKEIRLSAELENLDAVTQFAADELEENGCPPRTVMQVMVSVEEIFVNIAHYAYPAGSPGSCDISVEISDSPRRAAIRFSDEGIPFNPLERKAPDAPKSIDDATIGGLGILMVKKSMDDVTYSYENGHNVLTLYKSF